MPLGPWSLLRSQQLCYVKGQIVSGSGLTDQMSMLQTLSSEVVGYVQPEKTEM
jgi:hypothetical protein